MQTKIVPVEGGDNAVQKSNPLFDLWKSDFGLNEYRLLDVYLSKINSRMPENRTVVFNRSELEEIYGVQQLRKKDIQESLVTLQKVVVSLYDKENNRDININLFSMTTIEDKISKITMKCSEEAVKYFFNIDKIGYIRYRIGVISKISSIHSYLMFLYLEKNRFRGKWKISVEELKKYLKCDTIESYKKFKEFNDKILKKVYKDLTSKEICDFTYTALKQGRTVTEIEFTYRLKPEELIEPKVLDEPDESEEKEPDSEVIEGTAVEFTVIDKMADVCDHILNESELNKLLDYMKTCSVVSHIQLDNEEDRCVTYFTRIINKYKEQNHSDIKKPFHYIMKMIENDDSNFVTSVLSKTKNNKVREEQSYDIDKFEELAVTFSGNTKKKK